MPAAYSPSARFPSAPITSPCCHGSSGVSIRSNCARTDGHAVDTIPSGRTRCRARSDSFEPERGVFRGDAVNGIHRHQVRLLLLKLFNLHRDHPHLTDQGRQVTGQSILAIDMPLQDATNLPPPIQARLLAILRRNRHRRELPLTSHQPPPPRTCTSVDTDTTGTSVVSDRGERSLDRKSTRLNSSHVSISYAVFCLKKKNI